MTGNELVATSTHFQRPRYRVSQFVSEPIMLEGRQPSPISTRLSIDKVRDSRISLIVKTVVETPTFLKLSRGIWSEDERLDFVEYISRNPYSGELIKNSGGCRKVRWQAAGKGKSSGVRVIAWIQDGNSVTLLTIYRKSALGTIKGHELRRIQHNENQ